MLSSFRLPDLVLGVGIKADVTGSKQAAEDLKSSLQKNLGAVRGAGGQAGAMGAAALGLGAAGAGAALAGTSRALEDVERRLKSFMPGVTEDFRRRLRSAIGPVMGQVASGAAGAGASAAAATAKGVNAGLLAGLRQFRSLWTLIVGSVIIGTFKSMLRMLIPALDYIRASGAKTGQYGQFSARVTELEAVWENLKVQFGLMVISAMDLDKVIGHLIPLLIKLAEVFAYLADSPLMKVVGRMALGVAQPEVLKGLDWVLGKAPLVGWGGKDLGQAKPPDVPGARMSGAFMEGSVEAYRAIQGTMMRYAAATARNTKVAADALQKILQRAPEMGVVAG